MSDKLTLCEEMFYRMNTELMGHNSLVVMLKLKGDCCNDLFIAILKALFNRHPRLRAVIKEVSGEHQLEFSANFANIPVQFVESVNEEAAVALQQAAYANPILVRQYVWRAQCCHIQSANLTYIIFSFSHALVDGLAAYAVCKDFVRIANQIKTKNYNADNDALPLRFLQECSMPEPTASATETIENSFYWPYQVVDKGINCRKTGCHTVAIDMSELHIIKRALKQRKLSINSFLNGVLIKLLVDVKPSDVNNIVLHTPVSLRPQDGSNICAADVLCATRLVNTYHDVRAAYADDVFLNAAEYQQQLVAKVKCPHAAAGDEINSRERLNAYINRSQSKRDGFFMGFCISNLGVINFETTVTDTLQVEEFSFAASRIASDCALFINVCAYQGRLQLTFNYTEPMLQPEWVAIFAASFLREIYELNKSLIVDSVL